MQKESRKPRECLEPETLLPLHQLHTRFPLFLVQISTRSRPGLHRLLLPFFSAFRPFPVNPTLARLSPASHHPLARCPLRSHSRPAGITKLLKLACFSSPCQFCTHPNSFFAHRERSRESRQSPSRTAPSNEDQMSLCAVGVHKKHKA